MKTAVRTLVVALAAGAALLAPLAASAQTTVLRYSNWLPPGLVMREKAMTPWIAEVERVTNGRVKIETLPKVVGTVPSQFDVIRDGQADIGITINGYTPGRFDINEVLELPFINDDPELFSGVVYRFYNKHLAQYGEYKGVHVLSMYVVSPGQFFTSKKRIQSLADFKGLKLRSPQPIATENMKLLGATPVLKPAGETYELVSSGVLDGTMMPPESMPSYKLDNLLPILTILPGGFYNTVLNLLINEDKWKSLKKEDQEAITKISGETFARTVGLGYKMGDLSTIDGYRKSGKTVDVMSPQVVAEMHQVLKPIEQMWIDKAKKKGIAAPEKLIEALRADVAAAVKAGR